MKIPCSNCNQRLEIPEELAGQTIECPACNATLAVPTLETPPPAVPQVQESAPQAATSKKSISSIPKWAIAPVAGIAVVVVGLIMFFPDKAVKTDEESQRPSPPAEAKPIEPVAEVPSQQSAPAPEAKPVEPVAEAESPTKSEPKSKAMKANLLKGKWIEFGDTVRGAPETWEFHENGTVDIIHERKKMAGKYEVIPPDTVSMTAFGTTISAKISKSGDEITSVVGKYKKEGNHQAESKPVAEAAKPKPPTAKAPDISIHDAAERGNIKAVKQHIAAGTDVNAVGGLLGWTPLHFAAAFGHKEIVKLLVAKVADANTKVEHGFTPLHYASWYGHKEVVELLIGKGGADVNVKVLSGAKQGYTPLDFAFHNHRMGKSKGGSGSSIYSETADLLRKHGGKTGEELKAEGK